MFKSSQLTERGFKSSRAKRYGSRPYPRETTDDYTGNIMSIMLLDTGLETVRNDTEEGEEDLVRIVFESRGRHQKTNPIAQENSYDNHSLGRILRHL
eukprot:1932205-Amphidinium_carterae.1